MRNKAVIAVAIVAFACSEAASTKPDASSEDATSPSDASNPIDSSNPVDALAPVDASACGFEVDASSLPIVVNEIRAKGTEFVELYNPTSNAVDLSGVRVADTEADSGCPKTSEALLFPDRTMLASGAYLLVFSSSGDAGGPFTDCYDAAPSCWQATWGISNTNGETIFVLSGSNLIAASGYYPALAVDSGLSWGRLPNGTGNFAANTPTPGAANVAAP